MKTRYVKTPDQVERIQALYAAPAFLDSRSIGTSFLTDPAVVAEVLPPPLEPAAVPRVHVSVYEIRRSNCVGAFAGASVNLACTYRGQPGMYCLTMPMTTDTAVIFGRETYAEPKKLAEVQLDIGERRVRGTVTRYGITYIELSAILDGDPEPVERRGTSEHYYFKYFMRPDGAGLAADPELIRVTHSGATHRFAQGTASLVFRESAHDPVIDLPVLQLEGAVYAEGETYTRGEVVTTVPAGRFLPYAFAKTDDLACFADVGAGVRGRAPLAIA